MLRLLTLGAHELTTVPYPCHVVPALRTKSKSYRVRLRYTTVLVPYEYYYSLQVSD